MLSKTTAHLSLGYWRSSSAENRWEETFCQAVECIVGWNTEKKHYKTDDNFNTFKTLHRLNSKLFKEIGHPIDGTLHILSYMLVDEVWCSACQS